MLLEELWIRNLHQSIEPDVIIVDGDFVYLYERNSYVSKIHIVSGKTQWSRGVPLRLRQLKIFESVLYCYNQGGECAIIDTNNSDISFLPFGSVCNPFPGYLLPTEKVFITGGWRGYTSLSAYDYNLNRLWCLPSQRAGEKYHKFSEPLLLKNNLFLIIDYTSNQIEIIELTTGKIVHSLNFPRDIKFSDLGKPYQIVDNKIIFISSTGKLYTFKDDYQGLFCKKLNVSHISSLFPYFFKDGLIYDEGNGSYNLYRFSCEKVIWRLKIVNNRHYYKIAANQLDNDVFIIGGSLGELKVVKNEGRDVIRIANEERITTEIFKVNDLLLYGTKGKIKAFRYKL